MKRGILPMLLLFTVVSCRAQPDEAPAIATVSAAPSAPAPGDLEFAELTADWPHELLERCAGSVRDALGARDLVQGALDGVKDPAGKATAEIEDAKHWIAEGNRKLDEVRPLLKAGQCDGTTEIALEEAVQFYVKAGTAAMQAASMVK